MPRAAESSSESTSIIDAQSPEDVSGTIAHPFISLGVILLIFFVGVAIAGYHLRDFLGTLQLRKEQADFWDIVLKGVTGVVGLSTAVLAVHKYFQDKSERNLIAKRESEQPLLTARQRVFFSLANALSGIIQFDPGDKEWDIALRKFWKIYWGELSLVSDEQVDESVEIYSEYLWGFNQGESKRNKETLAELTSKVIATCRVALGENWDVKQDTISDSTYRPGMIKSEVRRIE